MEYKKTYTHSDTNLYQYMYIYIYKENYHVQDILIHRHADTQPHSHIDTQLHSHAENPTAILKEVMGNINRNKNRKKNQRKENRPTTAKQPLMAGMYMWTCMYVGFKNSFHKRQMRSSSLMHCTYQMVINNNKSNTK